MNWIKKYGILVLLIVVIVILTPIALHILIFENTYPSKVSNDGWAGFFGGYIGAIIGALATIIAIKLELNDNKKQRKIEAEEKYKDEIKNLRPYLCFHETNYVTDEHGLKLTLDVKNVGFHAAGTHGGRFSCVTCPFASFLFALASSSILNTMRNTREPSLCVSFVFAFVFVSLCVCLCVCFKNNRTTN